MCVCVCVCVCVLLTWAATWSLEQVETDVTFNLCACLPSVCVCVYISVCVYVCIQVDIWLAGVTAAVHTT